VALALDYCHNRGVVNRDVKLENTLLVKEPGARRPLAKLCDFGYSKGRDGTPNSSFVGTPVYMAPEVLRGQAYDGAAADVWSLGVMLRAMLAGSHPTAVAHFPSHPTPNGMDAMVAAIRAVLTADWTLPAGVAASDACRDLLGRMLERDPARRIKVPDILSHPFFLDGLIAGALKMNAEQLELDVATPDDALSAQGTAQIESLLRRAEHIDVDEAMIEAAVDEDDGGA